MARFKLFGRREDAVASEVHREPDDTGNLEVAETEGVVESIGVKYTMVDGSGAGGLGPGEPPQGREGWIEVIAAKDDAPSGLFDTYEGRDAANVTGGGANPGVTAEQPQGLWQGLVENQNVRATTSLDTWEHAATSGADAPSTLLAPGSENDASLVFQKVEPDSLSVELMFDSITAEDDWETPDV